MRNKRITIRDIAKEAGVSVATVSRYINKVSYTSLEAEKKIQEAMDKFDYIPNPVARGLAKQKSNMIALITPDITNPFFPELFKSIEQVAKNKGYYLILINSNNEDLKSDDFWKNFKSRYIDGFILAESEFNFDRNNYIESLNIPFVRVDRAVKSDDVNSVSIDNYQGARLAVNHLLEMGCKRIAHISGPSEIFPSQERLKGYLTVMNEQSSKPIVYEGDFTLDSGKIETENLMGKHPDVDGIFFANDLMAIGSLKAFYSLKINVPDEVAIIGFDGIHLTEIVNPEISTIEQPIGKIGEIATSRLIGIIEGTNEKDTEDQENELQIKLMPRKSSFGFMEKK